jgi:branched-chain amino acid transport system ATP-binding protein
MLRMERLSTGYGKLEVLRDVSLEVPAGSMVALVGPNGAGKTTVLRALAGLVPAWSGQVHLGGSRIDQHSPHERALSGLCLVPEGRGIFRHMTVAENLRLAVGGRARFRAAMGRAEELFPVLGQRHDQVAGTLSGGEQQMLALARSFVTNPKIVLADELSLGLAPVIVDRIFEALDVLRQEGKSLLVVEQFVNRVLAMADYVYVLNKGCVSASGKPSELTEDSLAGTYLGETAAGPSASDADPQLVSKTRHQEGNGWSGESRCSTKTGFGQRGDGGRE